MSAKNIQVNGNHDYQGVAKVKNITPASEAGDAVEYSQNVAELATKQDNISGGAGIEVDGVSVKVDLATSGSNYENLIVSSANYSTLDGTYARLSYKAKLEYSGTDLDLTIGDSDVDWNGYYKDNGAGVWAVVFKRDIDTSEATNPTSGSWLAVLVTTDPTSFTYSGAGTTVSNSFVPNYQAVDYDMLTYSNESSGDGKFSPSSADSSINYAAGSTPAGLIFDNNKLALDFAQTTGAAASTKVFPSSVIKTYTDEQITGAKDLSNNVFNNAVAQITGNPSNGQSMGEALASEIDTLDNKVSGLETKDSVQDAFIADNTSALGITQGDDQLPAPTGAATSFLGAVNNAAARFQKVGESIGDVYSNIGNLLGLGQFDTDFGTGFIILPNDADAKALFQATEAELQNLAQGLGQFWAEGVEVVALSNISVSNAPASIEGVTLSAGDSVLLSGQSAQSQNGIYEFNGSSVALTRRSDANQNEEFTPNKTIQDLATGDTWAYTGGDDPTVGTNVLPFNLKSRAVIADGTITDSKLTSGLSAEIDSKVITVSNASFTLTGGDVEDTFTHGLNNQNVIVQVYGDTGYLENFPVKNDTANTIKISKAGSSEVVRLVVMGVQL